jgi:uroporphyrinogen decarboxylase
MDIFDIKQKYGDKLTFWGGISTQQTLPNGTPDEVFSESSDIIRQMSVNGGYITCGSQEIQTDVPIENVHALIKAAKAFG